VAHVLLLLQHMANLVLEDGTVFEGESFGASLDSAESHFEAPSEHLSVTQTDDTFGSGEVVFNTGMMGYTESLTDPSYRGQILVFTYPLIGNYGVPSEECNEYGFSANFESEAIHVRGVIVAQESRFFSHHKAVSSLHNWLIKHKIPGITGVDTRALTKKLREEGVMLGRIVCHGEPDESTTNDMSALRRAQGDISTKDDVSTKNDTAIEDPNLRNLVAEVSCKEAIKYEPSKEDQVINPKTIVAYDCGMKRGILRSFLKRGVRVVRVPWDFDLSSYRDAYDGVFISNGPGNPEKCKKTIESIKYSLERGVPTFGICLGCQLMGLAIGGETFKLKYGHRGVNQPCIERLAASGERLVQEESSESELTDNRLPITARCIITSQNHGYAVSDTLPADWSVWFTNANDGTVEGIRHKSGKFFAVQFHPEATPGPEDANYLFDEFIGVMKEQAVECVV
jgi:carbamoyl-phosphate synthase small subunit